MDRKTEDGVSGPVPPFAARVAINLGKLAVLVAGTLAWIWIYGLLNARGCQPGRASMFQSPLVGRDWLYAPWMAYPYVFFGYVICWVPYVWNWRGRGFARVLATYTLGSLVLFGFYAAWPVTITRPAYDGNLPGEWLLRKVVAIDQPANCFPSSHAFIAVAAMLLVQRSRAGVASRVLVTIAAALVVCSTVTVGQHYFMDAVAGTVVAAASVCIIARLGWLAD